MYLPLTSHISPDLQIERIRANVSFALFAIRYYSTYVGLALWRYRGFILWLASERKHEKIHKFCHSKNARFRCTYTRAIVTFDVKKLYCFEASLILSPGFKILQFPFTAVHEILSFWPHSHALLSLPSWLASQGRMRCKETERERKEKRLNSTRSAKHINGTIKDWIWERLLPFLPLCLFLSSSSF